MRTRTVATAFALGTAMLALAGAAACGRSSTGTGIASAGGTGSASAHPSATVDPQEQGRAFAQCMREHGVDMPDPDTAGGGDVRITVSGDPGGADAAMQACRDKLPNGGAAPSMNPQQQEQVRAFAQCMREHGVDMPDPDENGQVHISRKAPGGPAANPDSPAFKAAEKACRTYEPGRAGQRGTGGGSGS